MTTQPLAKCPRCGAAVDGPCVTASGNVAASPHVARLRVVRIPRQLEVAVKAAAGGAHWLTLADVPAVDVALTIARKIDDAVWLAEHVAVGTMFDEAALGKLKGGIVYDAQTLMTILTALGLTPKGRSELEIAAPEIHDELADVLNLYGD